MENSSMYGAVFNILGFDIISNPAGLTEVEKSAKSAKFKKEKNEKAKKILKRLEGFAKIKKQKKLHREHLMKAIKIGEERPLPFTNKDGGIIDYSLTTHSHELRHVATRATNSVKRAQLMIEIGKNDSRVSKKESKPKKLNIIMLLLRLIGKLFRKKRFDKMPDIVTSNLDQTTKTDAKIAKLYEQECTAAKKIQETLGAKVKRKLEENYNQKLYGFWS